MIYDVLRHPHIPLVPLHARLGLGGAACDGGADAVRLRVGGGAVHGDAGGKGAAVVEGAGGGVVAAYPGADAEVLGVIIAGGRLHIAGVVTEVDSAGVAIVAHDATGVRHLGGRAAADGALVGGVNQGDGAHSALHAPEHEEVTNDAARFATPDFGAGGRHHCPAVRQVGRGGGVQIARNAAGAGDAVGIDAAGHRAVVGAAIDGARPDACLLHVARDAAGAERCNLFALRVPRCDDGPADRRAVGAAGHGGGVYALAGDATHVNPVTDTDADAVHADRGGGGGGAVGDERDVVRPAFVADADSAGDAAHVGFDAGRALSREVAAEVTVVQRGAARGVAHDAAYVSLVPQ